MEFASRNSEDSLVFVDVYFLGSVRSDVGASVFEQEELARCDAS